MALPDDPTPITDVASIPSPPPEATETPLESTIAPSPSPSEKHVASEVPLTPDYVPLDDTSEPDDEDADEVESNDTAPPSSSASAQVVEPQMGPIGPSADIFVPPNSTDLVDCVKGMYRVLDLVAEGDGMLLADLVRIRVTDWFIRSRKSCRFE